MKTLVIFLILALASHSTYAGTYQLKGAVGREHVERIFGDKIKESLENFKETMKTGNEAKGVPKLEPFSWEHQDIKIDEQLIIAHGEVNNSYIEGLSSYTVKYANYEVFRSTLNIDMLWSNIKGNLSYDLNATLLNKHPIFGAGNVSFELENFRFATDMKVSIGIKKLSITGFSNTKISLEKLKDFKITGLFNDEELSEGVGPIVSQMAPEFLVDFQEEITSQLNIILLKQCKEIEKKVDLWEVIHW